MSTYNIETALMTEYATTSVYDADTTAVSNEIFEPPEDADWQRVSFIHSEPDGATLGTSGEDLHQGIMQIDLNIPIDGGDKSAIDQYEVLRTTFKRGDSLSYGGTTVRIQSCGRGSGQVIDDKWYRLVVGVTWYAHISRA